MSRLHLEILIHLQILIDVLARDEDDARVLRIERNLAWDRVHSQVRLDCVHHDQALAFLPEPDSNAELTISAPIRQSHHVLLQFVDGINEVNTCELLGFDV